MASLTSVEVLNGMVTPQITYTQAEAVNTSGSWVGTVNSDFSFVWQGAMLGFRTTQVFIATPDLYAAINASATAAAAVTWNGL